MATITILADNRSENPLFATEHGLSIYMETDSHKLLLDTGASDLFITNAERAGIDLEQVNYLFLSHGHVDHTGGLQHFLRLNTKAKVLLSSHIIGNEFYSKREYLHSITSTADFDKFSDRLLPTDKNVTIEGSIHILTNIQQTHPLPLGNKNLYIKHGEGAYTQDDFRHEMALYTDGILFTGCAHSGLLNILNACPMPTHTVIGGFHLLDARKGDAYESLEELIGLARTLKEKHTRTTFYTSHCTGDQAFATMKGVMNENLQRFTCGETLEV